jgi:tetratricopeptide (TPR) repeat protein
MTLRGGFVADSVAYTALPAVVVPIVALVAGWTTQVDARPRRLAGLISAACVIALCILTFRNERNYRNNHALWARTLEQYPRSTYALNRVGEMELTRKQFTETELREMQVLRLDPDAEFAPAKKTYTAAESCFRQALAVDPNDWAAMINLGQVYLARAEWDRAASQFLSAERAGAKRVIARRCLADAMQGQGNSNEAIRQLQAVLEIDANDAHAHNSLGMIHFQRGEYSEAIAEYKRALQINARLVSAYTNLAGVYSAQGRHVDALGELTRAWEIEPDNAQTLMNVASVLGTLSEGRPMNEKLQLLREAEKRFKDAIALDSEFAQAWDNLGIVLARQAQNDPNQRGKMKDAVYAFSRAARLEPDNEQFARHVESAMRETGVPDASTK